MTIRKQIRMWLEAFLLTSLIAVGWGLVEVAAAFFERAP
jgi:hypothetical protein